MRHDFLFETIENCDKSRNDQKYIIFNFLNQSSYTSTKKRVCDVVISNISMRSYDTGIK